MHALTEKLESIDHDITVQHERARLLLDEVSGKMAAITNRREKNTEATVYLFTIVHPDRMFLLPPTLATLTGCVFWHATPRTCRSSQSPIGGTWWRAVDCAPGGVRQLLAAAAVSGVLE